jgi:hypothetical protein
MRMIGRRPSFSYEWSSDDESLSASDENQEAKITPLVLGAPVMLVNCGGTSSNRLMMGGVGEDRSSHTELPLVDMELPSVPKRQKTVRFCCSLSRRHAKKCLLLFIVMLFFVSGLLIGGFLLHIHASSSSTPSNIFVGAFYYPWHSGTAECD